MKIGVKIAIAGSILAAFSVGIAIYSLGIMGGLYEQIKLIDEDRIPKTIQANEIIDQANQVAIATRNMIIFQDEREVMAQKAVIEKAIEIVKDRISKLESTITTPDGKKYIDAVLQARSEYVPYQTQAMELAMANREDEARLLLLNELRETQNNYLSSINKLIEYQTELVHIAAQEGAEQVDTAEITLYIVLGVVILLAIGITLTVSKAITIPIRKCVEAADKIAGGETNVQLDSNNKDETGELMASMRTMSSNIQKLISELNDVSESAVDGKLDNRADENSFSGDYKKIMQGFNHTLDAVIGPLNVTAEYVDRISKGDIPPRITEEYRGDFNEIKNNLNSCIDVMNGLLKETDELIISAKNGKLDVRADYSKFTGGWGDLVRGVNELTDAFVSPINVTAEYIDRVSKGDIPPKITEDYKGDFNEIKNNLNGMIDVLNRFVADMEHMQKEHDAGDIDVSMKAESFQGVYKTMSQGLNDLVQSHINVNKKAINIISEYGRGNFDAVMERLPGKKAFIHENLDVVRENLLSFDRELNSLIQASRDGKLDRRGDSSSFDGGWAELVTGVNELIDAFVGPINVTAEYIDRVSKGDIPPKITDEYKGDFNEIKNNLNRMIDVLNDFVADMRNMQSEHDAGDIEVFMNGAKFQGAYRTMSEGLNTLVESHINVKKQALEIVGEYGKGNFSPLMPQLPGKKAFITTSVNQVREKLMTVNSEIQKLVDNAVDGNLQYRGNAEAHEGDFRKMVEGINKTLEAIVTPINEAGRVLSILATGDLTARMHGKYKGDLSKLKSDINKLAESLADLIIEVNEAVGTSNSSANEISSTADSLAAATQEQSAQADEVASAVEQMSRTVTDNAMSAGKTAEMAQKNGQIARDGGSVVKQTVEKMRDIAGVVKHTAQNIQKLGESSKKIGEIISVIDDIADQTNLLALNAAIEAARAGEQGRGFAVVADEVRKLAERTTEATKEIAGMIKGIQGETQEAVVAMNQGNEEVTIGIDLADRAGKSLEEILSSTQELMDMINQIAAASEEQSATSEQISKNVLSISKVTAESAHRIEDVAKNSDSLAKVTEHLNDLMSRFKVELENILSENEDEDGLDEHSYTNGHINGSKRLLGEKN